MFKVTYLDKWTDETKNFINKEDAETFAREKGWAGKNDNYVKLVEFVPETILTQVNNKNN